MRFCGSPARDSPSFPPINVRFRGTSLGPDGSAGACVAAAVVGCGAVVAVACGAVVAAGWAAVVAVGWAAGLAVGWGASSSLLHAANKATAAIAATAARAQNLKTFRIRTESPFGVLTARGVTRRRTVGDDGVRRRSSTRSSISCHRGQGTAAILRACEKRSQLDCPI